MGRDWEGDGDIVSFSVTGTPVPQGSMIVQRGKVRHSDSERLMGWRNEIAGACQQDMRSTKRKEQIWQPWEGPVSLDLDFHYQGAYVETPKDTAPDLDKLTRSVLDALTGVLYVDDKQVTEITCRKVYAGDKTGLYVTAGRL